LSELRVDPDLSENISGMDDPFLNRVLFEWLRGR